MFSSDGKMMMQDNVLPLYSKSDMMKDKKKISECDLQAVVDSALPKERRRGIMNEILNSAEDLSRLEELLSQKRAIKNYYDYFLSDDEE